MNNPSIEAAETYMPEQNPSSDNFNRLLSHLKDGSLAAQLVQAYRNPGATTSTKALKNIIHEGLKQARDNLERSQD